MRLRERRVNDDFGARREKGMLTFRQSPRELVVSPYESEIERIESARKSAKEKRIGTSPQFSSIFLE